MKILLIETSTERGVVAIAEEETILFQKELPFGYNNSSALLPIIAEALGQLQLSSQDLGAIAVGVGPGSYTGIRVGAIVAKSFAYVHKIPLVGISSLFGWIPEQEGKFAALIDAKIGGVYLITGVNREGKITYLTEPQICPLEKLGESLKEIDILTTPQSASLRLKLTTLYPKAAWKWEESSPSVSHLLSLVREKLAQGDYSNDGHLDLLYLRKTQAEIEREK